MKVVVTGANGFVGSHIMRSIQAAGHEVIGTVRNREKLEDDVSFEIADPSTDFAPIAKGADAVVHAAGVAHNPVKDQDLLRDLFREGNTEWTRHIAEEVGKSDVKVMIHISSIAAAGSGGAGKRISGDGIEEFPLTDYGRSKREAEPFVAALEEKGKLGVNLRPPLIYGSGTKGNWAKLLQLSSSGILLPFASVDNRRSYLAIGNLCDLVQRILEAADNPEKSGTYEVADTDVVSLREVVKALRSGRKSGPALIPFPSRVLSKLLKVAGKERMAEGLFEDLVLDPEPVSESFSWVPRLSTLEAMAESVQPSNTRE